jgi:hypothetical protein
VLAAAAVVAAAIAPAAAARTVAVVVVPPFGPGTYSTRGAVGLLVPGAGSTVTRAGAQSSLVRGKVVSSLLGGTASGTPLIELTREPAEITFYVSLPPPGKHHNVRRYPVAVVGGGYHGILTSSATRIPGLVAIADVAPSVLALERGRRPRIRSKRVDSPAAVLSRLDRRLQHAHDTRTRATIVLVVWPLVLAALALALRSRFFARAGLLAVPAALAVAYVLSATSVSDPGWATGVLAAGTGAAALAGAARERLLLPLLAAFLFGGVVALAGWPDVNALSVIGPHPDGGGRYYGVTNQVETLLLGPILAAAILSPSRAVPIVAAVALVLIGWSRTGADGGGVLVVLVALAVVWSLRERVRPTPYRLAAAAAAVILLGLGLVGLDAATGGSSHVIDALDGGPGSAFGDLGHRLRVSWHGLTATPQAAIAAGATFLALLGFALLRPRSAAVDALLAAVAVSLLVNDTPTDVLGFGALIALVLRVWSGIALRASEDRSPALDLRAWPAPLGR